MAHARAGAPGDTFSDQQPLRICFGKWPGPNPLGPCEGRKVYRMEPMLKVIATLCAALFTGGALYISLVGVAWESDGAQPCSTCAARSGWSGWSCNSRRA